ncbi:IclR family transcriptional regulator [Variovorax dokdonensis]|uniref:IclR family transcriptional regulator n=1 Tax=Variovorax dokdonensis TaxID=344883 RepID=A0ABT7NAS4_9BURK|nr:IclR family transcriptional regulator [Variovorax dokdonensis]MDM0045046.1 IclR family transcriptional regulator [Variovorax dokdonensis]
MGSSFEPEIQGKPASESGSTAAEETPGAQTLRRGLAILKLLARYQPAGLRMSEIGRKLELNKATAVRLTRTLVEERFVSQDPGTRSYRLGPESFAVGLAAEPAYELQRMAAPVLRSLAIETGEWVFFAVRQGFDAICLSRESGDIAYPGSAMKVGDHFPICVGSGGIAMLAALGDDEIEQAISQRAEVTARDYPSITPTVVRELVRETREKGYCVIPGIMVRGYWGLSVPLLRQDGSPVASMILVTTEARLSTTRRVVLGERMRRLAHDLMVRAEHKDTGDR